MFSSETTYFMKQLDVLFHKSKSQLLDESASIKTLHSVI